MNNPLTKEELQQMVQDAGKPVVVWLDLLRCKEKSVYAMFDGKNFLDAKGVWRSISDSGLVAYPDKPVEQPTLTADEQATLRYICKVYPQARYISINDWTDDLARVTSDEAIIADLPEMFFRTLPKGIRWEILISEDGTVTLEAVKNENS